MEERDFFGYNDNAKIMNNNIDNLYIGIDLDSTGVVGTIVDGNTITGSRYRGVVVTGSNNVINNEICSVTGMADIYDWFCNFVYYSGNACNFHQNNNACSPDPCNNPSCT